MVGAAIWYSPTKQVDTGEQLNDESLSGLKVEPATHPMQILKENN